MIDYQEPGAPAIELAAQLAGIVRARGKLIQARNTNRLTLHGVSAAISGRFHGLPLLMPSARVASYERYSRLEMTGYLAGIQSPSYWMKTAATWRKLYDGKDGPVNSAYGHVFMPRGERRSQWSEMVELLQRNPGSTRAGLSFMDTVGFNCGDDENDQPCSIAFTAHVVEGMLRSTYYMRSTDVKFGLPHDLVWAMNLSAMLAKALLRDHTKYNLLFTTSSLHSYDTEGVIPDFDGLAYPYWCERLFGFEHNDAVRDVEEFLRYEN